MRGQNHVEFRDLTVGDWFVRSVQDIVFRNITTRYFFIRSSANVRILGGSVGPSPGRHEPDDRELPPASHPRPRTSSSTGSSSTTSAGRTLPGSHVECLFLLEESSTAS